MKDVRVPEVRPADRSRQQHGNVLHTPAEDPHVEQGVAEIARDIAADAENHRPGQNDRENEVETENRGGIRLRGHAGALSARYSSSINTWMMAAVGTASNAPENPNSWLPINSALITVTALRPTV